MSQAAVYPLELVAMHQVVKHSLEVLEHVAIGTHAEKTASTTASHQKELIKSQASWGRTVRRDLARTLF